VKVNSSSGRVPAGASRIDAIDFELERLKAALLEILGLETDANVSRASPNDSSAPDRAVPLRSQGIESFTVDRRPSLPDPTLLEKIIANRQKRREQFGKALVADPAWDMLLDLAVARARFRRVSVTSLCIASGVPSTTALRWIGVLAGDGLIQRENDCQDRRRTFLSLSDKGVRKVASYFASAELPDYAPALG
jgi:DNA-binding MarR family transcriptional regulator